MRTLTVLNVALWGALLWMGAELLNGVRQQEVAGFPSTGQISYYVGIPALMLLAALAALAMARFTPFRRAAVAMQSVLLVILLPFVIAYTGGV